MIRLQGHNFEEAVLGDMISLFRVVLNLGQQKQQQTIITINKEGFTFLPLREHFLAPEVTKRGTQLKSIIK